jgi:hypothetical protein
MIVTKLPDLGFVKNVAVAMLLGARATLATADSTAICQYLFHYPPDNPRQYATKAVGMCEAASAKPQIDLQQWVGDRLNSLARGLETVCLAVEEAAPYIMDLRRTRDLMYGLLDVEEMLPLEQAVEVFRSTSVDIEQVVEIEEKSPGESEIVMPKAAAAGGRKSFGSLFEEAETSPKKKGKAAKQSPVKDLFG